MTTNFIRRMLRLVAPGTVRTADRQNAVLVVEMLGATRSRTPEGFLLCEGVPLSRTGDMQYLESEVPITGGDARGVVTVSRTADELFSEACVASFNGKPVVIEHPEGWDVNPSNWKQLAVGITLNPRRGEGVDGDVLLGDLLITDNSAIALILNNQKTEVSAGYDARYKQTSNGVGLQVDIICNHVALVDRGRCGARCSIGDHQTVPPTQESKEFEAMPTKTQTAAAPTRKPFPVAQTVRRFIDAAAALESIAEGDPSLMPQGEAGGESTGLPAEGTHTHYHLHEAAPTAPPAVEAAPAAAAPMPGEGAAALPVKDHSAAEGDVLEQRLVAMETAIAQMAEKLSTLVPDQEPAAEGEVKDETSPPAKTADMVDDKPKEDMVPAAPARTADSAALATDFTRLAADAEVLVPGFRVPTFDAALSRARTVDTMCSTRRAVLSKYAGTSKGAEVLDPMGGVPTASNTCEEVARVFKAAVGTQRLLNQAVSTRDSNTIAKPLPGPGQTSSSGRKVVSLADINAAAAKMWADA